MRLPAAIILLLTLFVACKKDEGNADKKNTWKLGTTVYTANRYTRTTTDFQAFDEAGNGLSFSFASFPTKDGVYNVVSNAATPAANEVKVTAVVSSSGSSYFAGGRDHTTATVKVLSPTKLEVSLQITWAFKTSRDSLRLNANLGEL